MSVLCHIAGPAGSGKTTILNDIASTFPSMVIKDLDDFDVEVSKVLGLNSTRKELWTDQNFSESADLKQKIMNKFLEIHVADIVILGGFHTEDKHILNIPTKTKFLLAISAEESARRAYDRSQHGDVTRRKILKDLPLDIAVAKKEIDYLLAHGYIKVSNEEIISFIEKFLKDNSK